jgi:hypothetical protein
MHSRDEKCTHFVGKPEGRDCSEDVGIDKRIILEWILGTGSGEL